MNDIILKILKIEEESNVFKTKPYYCSKHYPTIGWGFKCGEQYAPLPNITMTLEEGNAKIIKLTSILEDQLVTHNVTKGFFPKLDMVRQATLMSIAYQIGFAGLLNFRNTLPLIAKADWIGAGKGIRNSLAYKQTTNRWERNAIMIETGLLHSYYQKFK